MRCTSCGAENTPEIARCATCGASLADRYAPPASALGEERVPLGDELQPWERKRWRVSGLSWAAVWLAAFVPPLGFLLSFPAIAHANRFRKRPGNRAVAYAALGTALYMGIIWGVVGFTIWSEARRAEEAAAAYSLSTPYGDPFAPGSGSDPATPPAGASPDDMAQLQRLIDQLAQQPAPTE
jgi:hypothetical protein